MSTTKHETIHLTVGGTAQISIGNNPSTGFLQMLESFPSNVWLEDIEHIPPDPPMPGKPGQLKFTFMGVRPGKGKIRFVTARSPENVGTHTVYDVRVDKPGAA